MGMRPNNNHGLPARSWQTELPTGFASLYCELSAVYSSLYSILNGRLGFTMIEEYYRDILNLVPEMVLLLSRKGEIRAVNKATSEWLNYLDGDLVGRSVVELRGENWPSFFRQLKGHSGAGESVRLWDWCFLTSQGIGSPVEIISGLLEGKRGTHDRGILLVARDTSCLGHDERRLLRIVNETREQERIRIARDLHDGLGQELSGVKFIISAMARESGDSAQRQKLDAAIESLVDMLSVVRGICFNLMPGVLEEFGLVRAVRELAEHVMRSGMLRVIVKVGKGFPWVPKAMKIDVFRVIQEFMNNAIRHGQATYLEVNLGGRGPVIDVGLRENGKGFEPELVSGSGSGLRNMYFRIRSHGGTFLLNSSPGNGSEVKVRLVINQTT
jgi:PAS domain S-box-containing protein